MSSRRTNKEWTDATRTMLGDAAEELFADQGYTLVSAEAIARKAGVTRGAIQYQFGDRRGLFAHVLDQVLKRLAARLFADTMNHTHGVHEVAVGTKLFADAIADATIQRIVLIDGPAVLGWADWRSRCGQIGLPLLSHGLNHWAEAGIIAADEVAGMADLLLAALLHAGLAATNGDEQPMLMLHRVIDRLSKRPN